MGGAIIMEKPAFTVDQIIQASVAAKRFGGTVSSGYVGGPL
jgi:hypothetical protein